MSYLFLAQRWLKGVGSLHLIQCPTGFDHNALTHLATTPKLQKILSPDLHPIFTKCGNAPNTQNSYSLTMVWPLPLFIQGAGIFEKNINQDFFVKMAGKGGCKHCFSLIRYGFCKGNALYSASISFRMFIFLLTPFGTWECYFFRIKSQPGVAYKSVVYKKSM